MKRWATVGGNDAPPDVAPLLVDHNPLWDEHTCYVIEYTDDVPTRVVGRDGGEPEDQTLWRDWSWVVPALHQAYEDGKNDYKSLTENLNYEDGKADR